MVVLIIFEFLIRFHEFWLSIWDLVIFGSILNNCVKSNINDWGRLIMHSFCVFWAKQGHLRGTWIFMAFHGVFSLINEREEDNYIDWKFIYELWIIYRLYKGKYQFSELNSFYWVQRFISGGMLYLMDLWLNYKKWESYCILCCLNQDIYLSWPQTFTTYSSQNVSNIHIKSI